MRAGGGAGACFFWRRGGDGGIVNAGGARRRRRAVVVFLVFIVAFLFYRARGRCKISKCKNGRHATLPPERESVFVAAVVDGLKLK